MVKTIKDGLEKDEQVKEVTLNTGSVIKLILLGIVIIFVLALLFGSWFIINAGERGIVLRFGEPQPLAKTEGLHFKIPFVEEVVKMDIKTQKYEADASAASHDLQDVHTKVTLNYIANPEDVIGIYSKIGLNYQDKVIQPAVQEVVKASTATYTAEELVTKRPEVKEKIDTNLRERLREMGIIVQTVSITDFDFSESFNKAIEEKVTAEQNALAAKNKLAQVEYEAQQRVAQAKGESEAIKAQAEAIKAQGGAEYVQLQWINKWDGRLPQYNFGGNGATPLINVPSSTTTN